MKIIETGDWHLGLVVGGYDCHDDIVKAAKTVIEATYDADLLVIGGDLFHRPRPTPRAMAAAIDLLDSVGCPFIVFPGNHDAGRTGFIRVAGGRPVPAPDALEPLRKIRWRVDAKILDAPGIITVDDKPMAFACHLSDARAKYLTDGEERAQEIINRLFIEASEQEVAAVFCHLDVDGARPGSEGAFLAGGDLQIPLSLARQLNVPVVNQHIHRRQTIGDNIFLPGSIIPTDFADVDGAKGYIVLEV
jgi:hypothetical protein